MFYLSSIFLHLEQYLYLKNDASAGLVRLVVFFFMIELQHGEKKTGSPSKGSGKSKSMLFFLYDILSEKQKPHTCVCGFMPLSLLLVFPSLPPSIRGNYVSGGHYQK